MKAKKIVAIVTAVTMVLGCGITAMAGGSGSTTARGSSSQHIDRKYVSVTLPTSGTSTFNYIADPERIIQETVDKDADPSATDGFTAGGEYVTPLDEGIYFVTSSSATGNIYDPTSLALTAYNNSSKAVDLTVTVTSDYDEDGIQFADSIAYKYQDNNSDSEVNLLDMNDTPLINMNLVTMVTTGSYVGSLDIANDGTYTPVMRDGDENIATVTATLAGNPDNFKVKSKAGRYVYEPKDVDPKDDSWTKLDFCLSGECSYSDISGIGTAAPDLEVTWSWVENGVTPEPARPSITTTTANASAGNDTEIIFVGNASDITDIKFNATSVMSKVQIIDGKITVLSTWTDAWSVGTQREMTVYFTNGTTGTFTVTRV